MIHSPHMPDIHGCGQTPNRIDKSLFPCTLGILDSVEDCHHQSAFGSISEKAPCSSLPSPFLYSPPTEENNERFSELKLS